MYNDDNILYNNSEKLKYVAKVLGLKTKSIAEKLGVQDSFVSKLYLDESNKLKPLHLLAISKAYDIPMEIFEDKSIRTKEKVESILTQHQEKIEIFDKNSNLIDKLVGEWYMYSYPSNLRQAEVWETKTIFYSDGTVMDEHQNRGFVHIGQNQSIILKESSSSKNITSITFDNHQIDYKICLFSRVSKSNAVNRELFNFGLLSKNRIDLEQVKEILGDRSEVQIKVDYALLEQISSYLEIS